MRLARRRRRLLAGALVLCALGLVSCEDTPEDPLPQPPQPVTHVNRAPAHDTVFEVGGVRFYMKYVAPGTFNMGASVSSGLPNYDPSAMGIETPAHEVTLSPYLIAETEVSQALFLAVMGYNISTISNIFYPVHNVSYNEAVLFIKNLNKITHFEFRLPTEAEWEYAARGGGMADHCFLYSGSDDPDKVGWHLLNSDSTMHACGTKDPNALGLYDMSGNVMEWCSDWYGAYSDESQVNPQGPDEPVSVYDKKKVVRGGSYLDSYYYSRCTSRASQTPAFEESTVGFRLVMSVK